MRCVWLVISMATSLAASPALAAGVLTGELGLFYMNDSSVRSFADVNDQPYTQKTKTNYTFSSLGICYRLDWFCVGLKYLQGSIEENSSDSRTGASAVATETFSGPGLTLGYSNMEWVVHGTYLIGAQKKLSNKLSNSSGASTSSGERYPAKVATIIDVGYGFKVGSLRIGPLLSVLHMDYKERYVNGSKESLSSKESDDFIMPHFALWMDF